MSWSVGYQISFNDGGEPEFGIIQTEIANEQEAKEIVNILPAIAYKGNRPIKDGCLIWWNEP